MLLLVIATLTEIATMFISIPQVRADTTETIDQQLITGSNLVNLGAFDPSVTAYNSAFSQAWISNGDRVSSISVYLLKASTPTCQVRMDIYTASISTFDNALVETLIGSSTNMIAASSLTTSPTQQTFTFSNIPTLNGTRYAFKIYSLASDGGTISNSLTVSVSGSSTNVKPGGYGTYANGAWSHGSSKDAAYIITGTKHTDTSNEVSQISLNSWDNVQSKTASGAYYVYATDRRIIMFDLAGTLQKTWTIPFTQDASFFLRTNVMFFDVNNLVVASSYLDIENSRTYYDAFLLNVNTLTYSTIKSATYGNVGTSWNDYSQKLVSVNGSIYLIYGERGINTTHIERLTPTWQDMGSTPNYVLQGSTNWIPSGTSNLEGYIISRNSPTGIRYNIWKVNVVTAAFTLIGTSGSDNDIGAFNYLIGSAFNNSGLGYYDVLIAYPHLSVSQRIVVQNIRFNDSNIEPEVAQLLNATDAPVNTVRPIQSIVYNYGSSAAATIGSLPKNATVTLIYTGSGTGGLTPGQLMQYNFLSVDTSTATVTMFFLNFMGPPGPGVPTLYSGGDGTAPLASKVNPYVSASPDKQIGGFQYPSWNFIVYFDYTDGYLSSRPMSASAFSLEYADILTPFPVETLQDGTLVIFATDQYTYSAQISLNGQTNVTGTVAVYLNGQPYSSFILGTGVITGTSASYWTLNGIYQSFQNQGGTNSVVYGAFAFHIDGSQFVNDTLTYTFFVTVTSYYNAQLSWTVVFKTVQKSVFNDNYATPDTSIGGTWQMTSAQVLALLIPGMVYGGLAVFGLSFGGFLGLIAGVNVATVVTGIVMLIPPWVIVLIGILDIIVIFAGRR